MPAMPPLTWSQALHVWEFSPVVTGLVVLAVAGYLAAVVRVCRRGRAWPWPRTVAFLAAALFATLALQSAIQAYAMTLYWLHMVQHLLLIMVIPGLAVLAGPWTLLTACGGRLTAVAQHGLGGRVWGVLTIPAVGLACYTIVLVGTHLTSFMDQMGQHMWLHPVESVAYLATGYVFLLPLLSDEPIRRWVSYPLRLLWLMLAMGVDAFVGVTLMMTTGHPLSVTGMRPRAWGPAPLADLHAGGAVMWVGGAGLMLAFMVVALVQWLADPGRRDNTGAWLTAARRDALTEAARHAGTNTVGLAGDRDVDDDAALDAYNQTLAALARRSRDTETGDNAPKNGAQ